MKIKTSTITCFEMGRVDILADAAFTNTRKSLLRISNNRYSEYQVIVIQDIQQSLFRISSNSCSEYSGVAKFQLWILRFEACVGCRGLPGRIYDDLTAT